MSDTPCCSSSTSSLCSVLLVVSCRDARDKRERDRGGGCDRVSEQGGQVSKPVKLRGLTVQLHDYGKSATKIKIKNVALNAALDKRRHARSLFQALGQ